MPRQTIRIPEEMKREMDRRSEINWSEYIRQQLKKKLGYPKAPRKIKRLVKQYEEDLEKLWILHMFSKKISDQRIYETAELIFGEKKDTTIDIIKSDLEDRGLSGEMYKELSNGMTVSDSIKNELYSSKGIKQIKEEVRKNVQESASEVKEGIELLCLYAEDSIYDDYFRIKPKGLEKTWEIYSEKDVSVDDIVSTGLIYKDWYSSNAYSYEQSVVPSFGLELIEPIVEKENTSKGGLDILYEPPTKRTVKDAIEKGICRDFLSWLSSSDTGMNVSKKYVPAYEEEKEINNDESLNLNFEEFKEARSELVNKKMLIIDYSPSRSRTGNRASRPARWIYQLTGPAMKRLSSALLEKMGDH